MRCRIVLSRSRGRRRRLALRNYLKFDGVDSRDYGVYISGQGAFNAPARAYEFLQVPGRNGALIGNEKRLENIEVTYPAFIYTNFKRAVAGWRNFLLSRNGYCRLIDTYNPEEYRMAAYVGAFDVEATQKNDAGQFDLVFNCKPQRYLISGENVMTFTSAGRIYNPTQFEARPLLRVYGTGTVGIGNNAITITETAGAYTDIDCEMMDAFYGAINCNRFIQIQNNDFPALPAGESGITLSGITKVEITPRWFRV